MLSRISFHNLLSFGPTGVDLELRPLNVLIGPNASGKSNVIEAISLLQSMAVDLTEPIKDGGGIADWLWRGAKRPVATIFGLHPQGLEHAFSFTKAGQRFKVVGESILGPNSSGSGQQAHYFLRDGHPTLRVGSKMQTLKPEDVNPQQSIISQRRDPDQYPEITLLADQYAKIRIYRDWAFGRYTPPRTPQRTDERNDQLLPDSRNLALMVNKLRRNATLKKRLLDLLGTFIDGVTDIDVQIEGGTAQLFLEEGPFSVPATRLSDGTLRFLSLW